MFREEILKKAINFDTITNYLKARIEKGDWLDANEIKKLLIALEVEIKEEEKESK